MLYGTGSLDKNMQLAVSRTDFPKQFFNQRSRVSMIEAL